ncbi:hypothetical protein BG004_007819 [Podila humilis]|nr:hypothetical protein BG004_007819 [Podila humilis]
MEVLEVMKEANKARSTDHNHHHHHHHHRDDLRRMDEGDQGELEKQRLGTVAWDDLNQILPPASAFAAGYNPSNNISNSHKNTNHSRCSEAHGHSAIMSQELTRPASTATGRGSIQSGSQFSHLRRSDLPFALGHGHQQQDSVNSMQQFYYHHSNDYEDNEVEAYGYYRYSGNELREHQASRYSQDNYSNGYHEQQSDYSYRVHGYNQQQQGYKDSYMQLQSPSTTHYMYHQQTHQELNPQRLGRPLTLVRSHSTPGSVQLSETFRTSSTDLYQRNNNMSSNNNVNHATGGIIDCNSNRNNNGNDDNNTANSRVDDNGSKGSKRMTKTTSRTNDLKVGTHNPATKRTKHIEIVVVEEEEEEEKDQEIPLPLSGHTTVTGTVMAAEAEVCVVRGGNTQYPSNEDRNNPGQGNDDECYETAGSRYQYLSVDWRATKDRILPTSRHARNALIATIIAALVTIALEALLVQRHRVMITQLTTRVSSPFEISFFRPLTVYYCIFILAQVFAVGLLWDAAIHKNSLQLVAFTIFEWCMVSYSGLQIWQHDQLVRDIGIPSEMLLAQGDPATRLILFSQLGLQIVATVGITLLTWRLYSEFGWLVFQKLGADMSLRNAFFFFGYAIQIAVLTDKHWQKGMTEIAFAIPLSMIIMGLGFCALRKENKATMLGFIACLGLLVAYMIYRLIALYQPMTGDPDTDPYFFSRKTMTVFGEEQVF